MIFVIIIGIAIAVGVVYFYLKASQHSQDLYNEVIDEAMKETEDPKYGYGARPDESMTNDQSKTESKRKPKPIIYIYPTARKGIAEETK